MADEQYLRLTDAFADETAPKPASCLELTVRMLNINYGHNPGLMAACKRLDEYSRFVDRIKVYRQNGFSTDQSIDAAVAYCIDHGIMEDILLPFRAEVKKMLLTEYNERKYMRMFRKEAREEGRAEGIAHLLNVMLKNGASVEQISALTGMSAEEIKSACHTQKKPR